MSTHWARERAFSQTEAAEIIELPESTLRDWLASGAAPYVSKKAGSSRVLSASDIYILAVAKRLIAAGYGILVATAEAWRVAGGPDADVTTVPLDQIVVAVPGGAPMGSVTTARMFDATELVSETGSIIIPAGAIASIITKNAGEIYQIGRAMSAIAHGTALARRAGKLRGAA